jgi:hypothetical protein
MNGVIAMISIEHRERRVCLAVPWLLGDVIETYAASERGDLGIASVTDNGGLKGIVAIL